MNDMFPGIGPKRHSKRKEFKALMRMLLCGCLLLAALHIFVAGVRVALYWINHL